MYNDSCSCVSFARARSFTRSFFGSRTVTPVRDNDNEPLYNMWSEDAPPRSPLRAQTTQLANVYPQKPTPSNWSEWYHRGYGLMENCAFSYSRASVVGAAFTCLYLLAVCARNEESAFLFSTIDFSTQNYKQRLGSSLMRLGSIHCPG